MAEAPNPTVEQVRAFWNANPLFFGESRFEPGTREFFEEHLRATLPEYSGAVPAVFLKDVSSGTDVLDVGCGIGFWVGQFAALGARVTACDLTERAVEITRRRAEIYGLHADVRTGNAEALPFPPSSFDHVNCQGVIHHTPDTAACLREFYRVVRPGGTVCFSVYYRSLPLRSPMLFRAVAALARPFIRLRGRGRETMMSAPSPQEIVRMYDGAENPVGKSFTRSEVRRMLGGMFEVLEVRRFGFPRRVFPFAIPDGLHRVLARCFGLMIVFRCRKPDLTA